MITQTPQIFKHEEFGNVRILSNDGEPRFCLSDVCKILELPQVAKVVQRLGDEVLTRHPILDRLGRTQETYFVSEDGLYDVILDSRKPEAKRFRKWVTSEVLPSIRKTGSYINPQAIITPDFLRQVAGRMEALERERDAAKQLAAAKSEEVNLLKPKADYCEKVLESDEHLTSEFIAKEYGKPAKWLHEQLGDVLYKRGRLYFLRAAYADKGYRISETVTLPRGKTVTHHYWTQRGRHFVYNYLKKRGIVPLEEREDVMATLM